MAKATTPLGMEMGPPFYGSLIYQTSDGKTLPGKTQVVRQRVSLLNGLPKIWVTKVSVRAVFRGISRSNGLFRRGTVHCNEPYCYLEPHLSVGAAGLSAFWVSTFVWCVLVGMESG